MTAGRALPLRAAMFAALALAAPCCATESVELWPDGGPGDGASHAEQLADRPVDRSVASAPPDAAPPDLRPPDQAEPDAPLACVCRYNRCRSALECEQNIGPGSTCAGTLCSGAVGACTTAADCGSDPSAWLCTRGATAAQLCP